MEGRRIERLGRRGKYLVWSVEDDVHLAQHLRMTGSLLWQPSVEPAHSRVRLSLRPRALVLVNDPRRFGTGELLLGSEALEAFLAARLGLEPFDEGFTVAHLRALARGRTAPIKAFLLDQRRIAGIGNIYADEALHRAGVHPLRPAGRVSRGQWELLRAGVIDALQSGIDARGASIDDFRHIDGMTGAFQQQFQVYGREAEPCMRCSREIVKMVVAGRGTYVCEVCQPRPRRGGVRAKGLAGAPGG
jgi:formamidopyrimidine-DNA glycosylase